MAMSASGTNQNLERSWVDSACNGVTSVPNTVSSLWYYINASEPAVPCEAC